MVDTPQQALRYAPAYPVPTRRMAMIKIEKIFDVKRSPEHVYRYICDPANANRWNTWILEANPLTPGPIAQGTRVKTRGRFLGVSFDNEWEFTDCRPPESFSVRTVSGPLSMSYRYDFMAIPAGTRVTARVDGDPGKLFKVAEPVMAVMARRQFNSDNDNLKDLLEAEVTALI
jgi:hypothetical protein